MLKNLNLSTRPSRGFKLCPSCGELQGQRRKICLNEKCELRKKLLACHRQLDPIKLTTINNSTALYSLRTSERSAVRNFAEITITQEVYSSTISRNAKCFVESCNGLNKSTEIDCQHIKACLDEPEKPMPNAEVYSISREVLWNLNIDANQKQSLWNMYLEETSVPPVQCLNTSHFAVKCTKSKFFPAGRLHVITTNSNGSSKKSTHSCACKKLKIILEADNSVVMQNEICDHILLVLAGVLSKPNGKHKYKNFLATLKSFWMPLELDRPVVTKDDAFFDLEIGGNFDKTVDDASVGDDIFIFDDKFLESDNLPDFTDIVLDITPADLMQTTSEGMQKAPSLTNTSAMDLPLLFSSDPNLVSSCNINEEDIDMRFIDMMIDSDTIVDEIVTNNIHDNAITHLDDNIELLDQFELTDRIDLCSDDIDLPNDAADLLDVANSISILTTTPSPPQPTSTVDGPITISLPPQTSPLLCYHPSNLINPSPGNSLLKSNQNILPATLEAPPIELPTIVVKKTPSKASQIVSEIKTRTFPHIPAKRALIVNTPAEQVPPELAADDVEPSLAFSAWLEFVIENLNESIEIVEEPQIIHTFQVHEEMFAHFSKTFSAGNKRRMPHSATVIKSGKHKGLIRYIWYFPTAATVRRIFSTKNLSLETQRAFQRTQDGEFVRYIRSAPPLDEITNPRKKRIYPKLELYMAHIWFDCNSGKDHKTGFKIEWIPNVFPKSRFGVLKIEFTLGIKQPALQHTS